MQSRRKEPCNATKTIHGGKGEKKRRKEGFGTTESKKEERKRRKD